MTSTVSDMFCRHGAAGGLARETVQKKKDKMEQAKRREREIKEARKMELKWQKEEKERERRNTLVTVREERQLHHDTKRAHKEKRIQDRREERRNNGMTRSSVLYASQPDGDFDYFFDRLERVCRKNWRLLVTKAREARIHVFTCVIQSLRKDGKDRGLDYRLSGFQVQPGSVDARPFIPELAPRENEICLPKTSSSVFNSTNLNYLLGNMGVEQLIVCGCLTDQCIDHAVRDACDLGYLVTCVEDACATFSEERHENALRAFGGYCRIRTTAECIQELQKE
ncbi:hypothetical protein M9434_005973 [Picochlorum sp. BPE23]|nr:hypothetical protein M9434_005973 [Picochlorum sp. BPE23]